VLYLCMRATLLLEQGVMKMIGDEHFVWIE
jgi:hypothetical protein